MLPTDRPSDAYPVTIRSLFFLLLLLLLGGCAGTPEVPASVPDSTTPEYSLLQFRDERKWTEDMGVIVVDNPYGEIQLRQTQSSSLAFHANEQRIGATPRVARIEWIESDAQLGLRVRYDEHDPDTIADPRLGRVDLAVFVPAGPRIDLRTDFGSVVVRRVRNPVDARSRSGRIVVAARDAMQLRSQTGELRAFPMQGDWSRPLLLQTNGNVIADVPLFQGLDLQVNAEGVISADFPMDSVEQATDGSSSGRLLRPEGELQIRIQAGGDVNLLGLRAPIP